MQEAEPRVAVHVASSFPDGLTVLLVSHRADHEARAFLTARLRGVGADARQSSPTPGSLVIVVAHGGVLPRMNLDATRARALPHVAFGGGDPDEPAVLAAAAAGLSGWLPDWISDESLVSSLSEVVAGGFAWRRRHTALLLHHLTRHSRRTILREDDVEVALTPREYDVLERIAYGSSTVDVARQLGVAPVSIRGYLASAVRRLHADDRADAARLFARHRQRT